MRLKTCEFQYEIQLPGERKGRLAALKTAASKNRRQKSPVSSPINSAARSIPGSAELWPPPRHRLRDATPPQEGNC